MNFQHQHFGRIAEVDSETQLIAVDVGALVRRLILFDRCRVDSINLQEIPALVKVFGVEGLLELLDSGAMTLVIDVMSPADITQASRDGFVQSRAPHGLPHDGLYIGLATGFEDGEHREDYVSHALQEVRKCGLEKRDDQKLRLALATRVGLYPRDAGKQGIDDTCFDLERRDPIVLDAIRMAYKRETDTELSHDVSVEIERLAEKEFRIALSDSNLSRSEVGRRSVSQGVLAVAGLNQTLNSMSTLQAVTGLRDAESELFQSKLRGLSEWGLGDNIESQFNRVIRIGGLPSTEDMPAGVTINVEQLMKIRESEECIRLREWLRNTSEATDLEVAANFQDLQSRIASVTNSRTGKAIRFMTASLAGNIPVVGIALGPAVSAADQFLIDNVVGKPGPAMFLSHNYPSLFEYSSKDPAREKSVSDESTTIGELSTIPTNTSGAGGTE